MYYLIKDFFIFLFLLIFSFYLFVFIENQNIINIFNDHSLQHKIREAGLKRYINGDVLYFFTSRYLSYDAKSINKITARDISLVLTDENSHPAYNFTSHKAVLQDNFLLFNDLVRFRFINDESFLVADSLTLDLETQDIFTKDKVKLHGSNYIFSGDGFFASLHRQDFAFTKGATGVFNVK